MSDERMRACRAGDTPTADDAGRGLYRKFDVKRVKPSSPRHKHDECEYFVLDMTHDPHAAAALYAYALSCDRESPELAADLVARVASGAPGGFTATVRPAAAIERVARALSEVLGDAVADDTPPLGGRDWTQIAERFLREIGRLV